MEKLKIEGQIEEVEETTGGSGNVFYKFKVNGKTYSTFEDPADFEGKFAEVTYTEAPNPRNENAPYRNVIAKGIILKNGASKSESKSFSPKANFNIKLTRDLRSYCLAYAKDIAVALIAKDKIRSTTDILKQAEKFYEYVNDGNIGD